MATSVQPENCSRKGDGRYDCAIEAFSQAYNNSRLYNERIDIMKKHTKLIMSALMALTLTVGTTTQTLPFTKNTNTAIVAEAANGVIRGCFNGYNWTGTTTVHSNNTRKACKIKICTFDLAGWWNYGKFDFEVYGDGRYIGTYNDKSRGTFTLPKGYSTYKVKLRIHKSWNPGWNFTNSGKCVYWSIDGGSNCWV